MNTPPPDRGDRAVDQRAYRLSEIDLLRGLVLLVMALDHVRDFLLVAAAQDPMTSTEISPGLFATRWITHFCAPVFVLLAGTSAGLMTARRSPGELTRFLFTRGLWLVFVEWFVIATAFTFAPRGMAQAGGLVLVPLQVIWAIGASMIVLALAQRLGRAFCLAAGIAIVALHNLLDPIWPLSQQFDQGLPLWVALHGQMARPVGPFLLLFVYPLLPWIGVMLLGFGIAGVFERPAAARQAMLLRGGLGLMVAFVVLRALGHYGDPNPWQLQPAGITATVIDFLNTTKYPPSLAFLLMTLAPAAILLAYADRITGFARETLVMFGRAPFAFYVAHVFLIHALSILLGVLQGFEPRQFLTIFFYFPQGYGVSLPGVYAAWLIVIATLYPLSRWVAGVKARRRDWWLSYL